MDLKLRIETKSMPEPNTGCWIWTDALDKGGYGRIKISGEYKSAHRASFEAHKQIIPKGLCVCHKCDNRSCVNPYHLFLGTHQENIQDMVRKGRSPNRNGDRNGRSKLNYEDVKLIIKLYSESGLTQAEIASKFGVGHTSISNIIIGKTWKNILR